MNPIIIYKQDNGAVAIIYPTPDALAMMSLDAVAKKDVPTGKPYKLTDTTYLPIDRTNRDAWTIADSELIDGVGA